MNALQKVSLAIAASLSLPASSQAQDVSVTIKRYELATLAGQRAVITRIARASRHACLDNVMGAAGQRRCAQDLGAQMIGQLNSPVMTALWSGKGTAIASR